MRRGIKTHWDDCGYAVSVDSVRSGRPVPLFTSELRRWIDLSQQRIRGLYAERLDARTMDRAERVVLAIAQFAVADYALADGRQFSSFSRNQLVDELGWNKKSVDNALHVCLLKPTRESSPKVREFCAWARETGLEPVIRVIELGDKTFGTAYELVGIEPSPLLVGACRDCISGPESGVLGPESVACGPEKLAAGPEPGVLGPETVVFGSGLPGPIQGATGPETLSVSGPGSGGPGPDGGSGPAGPSSSHNVNRPSLSAEESYQIVLSCFSHAAGNKGPETRRAFDTRVAQGWTPEAIAEGARRYRELDTVPGSKRGAKWSYPLKWLLDDDHFKAVCPRVERASVAGLADFKAFFAFDAMNDRIPCVQRPGKNPVIVTLPIPAGIDSEQLEDWLKREHAGEVAALMDSGY